MSKFVLDLFFAATFAVLILILTRTKSRLFSENAASYRYSITGLTVLFFVSVLQLIANQRLFWTMPFLSESMYLEMVEIIGIISGITLLIAGASLWIPGHRRGPQAEPAAERADDITGRIILEIIRNKRPEYLFEELPMVIARSFGFDALAVLKYSNRNGRVYLAAHDGLGAECFSDIRRLVDSRKDSTEIFGNVGKPGYPAAELPIRIAGQQVGGMYFWKSGIDRILERDQIALNRISEVVSSHIAGHFSRTKSEYYETGWRHYFQLVDILRGNGSLKSRIALISELFHQATGSEYFSLAVMLNGQENIRRYTCGLNGNILLDGLSNPVGRSGYFAKVVESGRGVIIQDAVESDLVSKDSLIIECGQNSLLAVPMTNMGRVLGVLTLGHKRAGFFDRRRLFRAEMLASALIPAAEKELGQNAVECRERYLHALLTFDRESEDIQNIDMLLNRAAEMIQKNLMTTMVRIGALDAGNMSLSTRALHTIRPFDRAEVEKVNLSSKTTFWHHLAACEQRPLLISRENSETRMSKSECEALVFDTVQSALIVPITINGLTFGLITLGEERKWQRYSYDAAAINFVRELAARVAMAIKLLKFSQAFVSERTVARKPLVVDDRQHLLNRLKSPASTIRGSLELLKREETLDAERSRRLVSMMDESTEEIMAVLNDGQ